MQHSLRASASEWEIIKGFARILKHQPERAGEDVLRQQTMYECKALRRHRLDAETKLDAERAGQKSKEGTLRGVLFDCR